MKRILLKAVSCVALFFFCTSSLFAPGCFAEKPCWNDGSITYATGGQTGATEQPQNQVNEKGNAKAADPVEVSNGNYYYQIRDLFIPSRGLPLEIVRNYNSLEIYEGPFGIGWSHSYNIFLMSVSDGEKVCVVRRNADGSKNNFLQNVDSSYTAPHGCSDTLTKDAAGYTILDKHGFKQRFDLDGRLTSLADRNLNQITLEYDPATHVLLRVADSLGRAVTFSYNANHKVTSITDFAARATIYEYDGAGNLYHVTTPPTDEYPSGLITTYSYDANHRITSITDAKGQAYVFLKYDDNGRAYEVNYGGGVYHFDYQVNLTILTDPKGYRTDYVLNPNGTVNTKREYSRYVRPQDPLYYETRYYYNVNREIVKIVYPRGNWTKYTFDSKGNLLEVRNKKIGATDVNDPSNDIITQFTHESRFNFIKTATDPKNNVTTYTYDYELGTPQYWPGNLVTITYPTVDGITPIVEFTYNAYGQVETITDPNNIVTKYVYYPETGYLKQIINDSGSGKLNITQEFECDNVGNATIVKDGRGHATAYQYNKLNQMVRAVSSAPFNYLTKYFYDEANNLKRVERQADNTGSNWQTMRFTYNILDKLKTATDSAGNVTTYGYDANYNLVSILDAENNFTSYSYDERGMLWRVTDALGCVTEFAYDANANLKEIKDANANMTTYSYDDFDRFESTTYADSTAETYTYDKNSNLITKINRRGQAIIYDYDNLSRLYLKTLPDLPDVEYRYDLGNRLTDAVSDGKTLHYDYDNLNRVQTVTYTDAKTVGYDYDAAGNRNKLTYPDSNYITYHYDELSRLTDIKDQSAQVIAHYSYDALSRRKQLDLANSTKSVYDYDNINRLTGIANQTAAGANISMFGYPLYDKVGNRKSMVVNGADTHNYTYDKLYQLKTVDYPPAFTFADTIYDYDDMGNLTSKSGGGVISYVPNDLNQYSFVAGVAYSYDADGNLTSSATNTYSYDSENRLISATTPTHTASYGYDAFGKRISKTVDGVTTKYLYDEDQIIAEYDGTGVLQAKYVYGAGLDEPIRMERGGQSYYYHYDGLGSVTTLTDSTGSTAESYSYDAFGTPSSTSAIGNRYMFTGREYDAETGLYHYRARSYSPAIGRFNQTDPIGMADNANLYTYVGNNPVNRVDPYGLMSIAPPGMGPGKIGGGVLPPPDFPPVGPITPPTPGGGITNHPHEPGDIIYEDDNNIVIFVEKKLIRVDKHGRRYYLYVYKIINKKTGEVSYETIIRAGEEEPEPKKPGGDDGENKCKK